MRLPSAASDLVRHIKSHFQLLDPKQKSKLNHSTLKFFSRDIDILGYLEEAMSHDFLSIGLRYLFVFLTRFPDLQEVDAEKFDLIKSLLCDCWAVHSSRIDDFSFDDSLILFILKTSELVYCYHRPAGQPKIAKRSILSGLDWSKNHIGVYVKHQEFWVNMLGANLHFYRKNPMAVEWMYKCMKDDSLDIEREDDGSIARFKDSEAPRKKDKQLVLEVALTECVKWQISYSGDLDKINKFCKACCGKHGIKNPTVQAILLRCEDLILNALPLHRKSKALELTRENFFEPVFEFLDAPSGLNLLLACKKNHARLKQAFVKAVLAYGSFNQDTRLRLWNCLVSRDIRQVKVRRNLALESRVVELIEMDLARSLDFFEHQYFEEVKLLLINIAHDYPEVCYYQGMNYLGIFLFYTFHKDTEAAYHFFAFMVEHVISKYFGQSFQGILKLIFVVDKLLERIYPSLWNKLSKGQVSSIHFSVPSIITLFTSLIKTREAYAHIYEIWDTVISQGMCNVVKALLLLLEIQQSHLFSVPSDNLLLVMKNVEKDPFAIVKQGGVKDISQYIDCLTKGAILGLKVDRAMIEQLEDMFDRVRKPILDEWDSNTS